ncbi:type VI secretion system lipoprotein TssJ [Rosenbergiella australiborealis]|uniref:type VI secretion system lipoprotein TssJ n=1 Tax=Rosenbergiella australiborealis TaxID=1544696 RepID=UPI001F4E335C|nr:type VI secretion system lipoprotein TssJ [Rosenbergiella australiborealis]
MPLIYLYTLFCAVLISGCTIKPTTRSDVNVTLSAASNINKNKQGHPSPVQLFIYAVNNRDNFSAENPLTLIASPQTTTSGDYQRIADIIIQPGEEKSLSLPLQPGTNTFAFVVAYREMVANQWLILRDIDNSPRFIWQTPFTSPLPAQQIRLRDSSITFAE